MATIDGEQAFPSANVAASPFIDIVRGEAPRVTYQDGQSDAPGFTAPQLEVLSTFSADFRTARTTPWVGAIADFPDDPSAVLVVIVRYSERNETIVARDAEGSWCWPFDIEPDNNVDLSANPGSIQLLPRGGWPPCDVEIQLAAAVMAQEI